MAVRIGVPAPTSNDPAYNHACWPEYLAAVAQAGGEAVRLPLGDLQELDAALHTLDGYVLPGSPADVDPRSYGQERQPGTAPADIAREAADELLLADAAGTGKPVLAICFGLQKLNVWRGGSLLQDLSPVPLNHAAGRQVAVAHTARVEPDSLLGTLLSEAEAPRGIPQGESLRGSSARQLPVNSSHHQAILDPGRDLAVVARSAEDGVIEALEGRIGESAMVGVQWHPERSVALSAASRALFLWLVAEAEDRRGSVTLEGVHASRL